MAGEMLRKSKIECLFCPIVTTCSLRRTLTHESPRELKFIEENKLKPNRIKLNCLSELVSKLIPRFRLS